MPTRVGTYEMEIMEKKIKLGLIGLGHLGKIHLKCLKDTSFEIQGIFDVDQELCKTLAEAHNVKMYETGESLIEDCDAIDIVSPTTTHFYWAKKVLLANKHVFVEKPITADLDEAKEILDLYNTRSIKFQIGHVERFNPAFLSLKDKNLQPRFIEGAAVDLAYVAAEPLPSLPSRRYRHRGQLAGHDEVGESTPLGQLGVVPDPPAVGSPPRVWVSGPKSAAPIRWTTTVDLDDRHERDT